MGALPRPSITQQAAQRVVHWRFPSRKFRWLHPKYRARHKCFYGGRGGAKSHSAARMALVLADKRRMRILCTRQIQVSIAESMYRLLVILIEEMGLTDRFQVLRSEIRNLHTGSVFIFRGLADVKSMESIDLAIIEEAQQVTKDNMDRLIPTMRKRGSQMWWLWNPENEDDAVHSYFLGNPEPPPNTILQLVNYTDNPNLSQEMVEEADYMRRTNEPLYRHIWLGECKPKGVGWTFINPAWLDYAASGAVKPLPPPVDGRWALGCDPAFQGVDLGVIVLGQGNKPLKMEESEYSKSGDIAAAINDNVLMAGRFNIDVAVDCNGPGNGVGDILEDDYQLADILTRCTHKNEDYVSPKLINFDFDCWRSQAWWQFRCDLEDCKIDLSELAKLPTWQLLRKEILAHQMTIKNGKMRVTSKDQLRKKEILGWSPGRADSTVAWNWVRKRDASFAKTELPKASLDYGFTKPATAPASAWL